MYPSSVGFNGQKRHYPQVVDFFNAEVGTGFNTIDLNVPPDTEDGDLLVAVIAQDDNSAVFTAPAGWTSEIAQGYFGGSGEDSRIEVYYRTASTEPASYTWTTSGTTVKFGAIFTLRKGESIVDSAAATDIGPGESVAPTPALTSGSPNFLIMIFAFANKDAGGTFASATAPAGTSTLLDVDGNTVATRPDLRFTVYTGPVIVAGTFPVDEVDYTDNAIVGGTLGIVVKAKGV